MAARPTDQERAAWKARYEAGETLEQISLDTGRAAGTIARHLRAVGTEMRPAKPPRGPQRPAPWRSSKTPSGPVVHTVPSRQHRRRGRYW